MALYSHHKRQRANPVGRRHTLVSAFRWRLDNRLYNGQLGGIEKKATLHISVYTVSIRLPCGSWTACALQAIPSGQFQML